MGKKLRSLTFICQTLGLGGAETVNRDMLLAAKHEADIQLNVFTNFLPFIKQLSDVEIDAEKIPIVIDIIGNWKGLLKALVLWPFAVLQYLFVVSQVRHTDVIVMSGFIEKIMVSPIAKLFDIPVVWVEFAPMTALEKKFLGLPFFLYRLATRLPSKIIVPTAFTEKYFTRKFPQLTQKIAIVPCGRYQLPHIKTSSPNHPTIVCVSRMEQGKGQDLLVRAFAEVKKKIPEAKLLFVGEGDFLDVVKNEVAQLNLTDSVIFLGRVAEPLEVMANASVCIFPSVWQLEGFGMVTIEAMSLGKPIVAFKTGPTPEIVQHNQTALLAQAGDIHDLAAQITNVIESPQLAQKIGSAAKAEFEKSYRFETLIANYIHIFEEAINA